MCGAQVCAALAARAGPGVAVGAEVAVVELVEGHDRYDAAAVTGAVDRAVVDAHEVTVSRQPHIALEGVGAVGQRAQIGVEGVLGCVGT